MYSHRTFHPVVLSNIRVTQLFFALHKTPYGPCLVATTPEKILCYVGFVDKAILIETAAVLVQKVWPNTELIHNPERTLATAQDIFSSTHKAFQKELPIAMNASPFQQKVWIELLNIPYAETRSYKEIAERINNPLAIRSVAQGIGRNHLAYVVPCHRVIGASGNLVGYRWGLDIKQKLLDAERFANTSLKCPS